MILIHQLPGGVIWELEAGGHIESLFKVLLPGGVIWELEEAGGPIEVLGGECHLQALPQVSGGSLGGTKSMGDAPFHSVQKEVGDQVPEGGDGGG